MELFYFAQRGPFAGYWRRVPLHSKLTARGHFVRAIPKAAR